MDNYSLISAFAFVLNSVLMSGFIIPQVQKLKEIKDKLTKFKITHPFSSDYNQKRIAEQSNENEIKELHEILDVYRIRSQELNLLVKIFYLSVLLAVLGIVCVYFCGHLEVQIFYYKIMASKLTELLHLLFQLGILPLAIYFYAIKPDKLQDVGYLVRDLGINPHALAGVLGLGLSCDSPHGLIGSHKREDPLVISLTLDLRVFGFRFLYVVYGEDKKIYFISYGPIVANTKELKRYLVPVSGIARKEEYNSVEIGRFAFNMVEKKQDLKTVLLIFLPFFSHEEYSPMLSEGNMSVQGRDSGNFSIGSWGGMWPITPLRTYPPIKYRGQGINIKDLKFEGTETEIREGVLSKVLHDFRNEIATCKNIAQESSIEGDLGK